MGLHGVVAVDGPSGTGKSTVARELARRLDARYLDTGAMYRAVAWAVLRAGVDPHDDETVAAVADRVEIVISTDTDDQRISLAGRRIDREIRGVEVTSAVSPVSAVPAVRARLVAAQRELINQAVHTGRGIVVEGRDIGTVVVPDAGLKVFLTASDQERALRRSRQNGSSAAAQVAATRAALAQRDRFDSSRDTSPLRTAHDAVEIDTTPLPVTEVVGLLAELARVRGMVSEAP